MPISIAFYIQVGKCYTYNMCAGSSNSKTEKITGIVFMVLSVISIIYVACHISGNDIWYDEVFSMGFIRGNVKDIIRLTSKDVHPPLYYIYLKAVTTIATAVAGKDVLIPAAKLASIIPWAALAVVSITLIRKRFGTLTAGVFMLLVVVMPQLPVYYTEIRMYSLALLAVTAEVLLALMLCERNEKKAGPVVWVSFCLIGILTAYIQYYACIAIVGIYAGVLAVKLIYAKEDKKKEIRNLLICAAVSVAAYLPWLPVLKSQIENISGSYWIQPLTLRSIAGCAKFIMLPVINWGIVPYIAAAAVAASIGLMFIFFLRKLSGDGIIITVCCLSPILMTVISGFILSAAGTPIFIYRYMIPAIGGCWLAVAIYAGRLFADKRIWILALIPFIFAGWLNLKGFGIEEGKKPEYMAEAEEVLRGIPEEAVLITNFDHVTAIMGYYMPQNKVYLYDGEPDPLICEMFEGTEGSLDDEGVSELAKGQSPVFFMGSFNSREDIVDGWRKMGIDCELKDEMLIERYWIDIYKLD